MRIVVGLGNPGIEYRHTRHNLGFLAIEEFCRLRRARWSAIECGSRIARGRVGGEQVLMAKPQGFMNRSGESVACLLESFRSNPEELLILCDDAALDLGRIRIRPSGSDGGHRGLRSIAESIGTEAFPRLRLGIRTARLVGSGLADEVLAPFDAGEWEKVKESIASASECILVALEDGVQAAMNRFNRKQPRDPGVSDGENA